MENFKLNCKRKNMDQDMNIDMNILICLQPLTIIILKYLTCTIKLYM